MMDPINTALEWMDEAESESRADRRTRWEEQGRPMEPAADERESRFDDENGGGPED